MVLLLLLIMMFNRILISQGLMGTIGKHELEIVLLLGHAPTRFWGDMSPVMLHHIILSRELAWTTSHQTREIAFTRVNPVMTREVSTKMGEWEGKKKSTARNGSVIY